MKTLMMSTAAAVFAAGTAYAADVFVVVDTDEDGIVTMEEYHAAFAEPKEEFWFDVWDADRDGMLTRDEILAGEFATFDVDGDKKLNEEELAAWNEENMRYNAMRSGRQVSQ